MPKDPSCPMGDNVRREEAAHESHPPSQNSKMDSVAPLVEVWVGLCIVAGGYIETLSSESASNISA
jgi:hypothetical protein